jgi:DNA-binding GntR family transcriptional regulator
MSQRPLKEQAYNQLKELILNEDVPMNGFLSERNLAEKLGMSKTPIRLAIERLEHEGFVRVSPQQGIVVVSLGFEDILDYVDYRLALESFVVGNIAGKLSKTHITSLKANLLEQQTLLQKDSASQWEKMVGLDMRFHKILATINGNKQIVQALERQQDMLFRVANRVFRKHPSRLEQSYLEHKAIVQAMVDGQSSKAVKLISEHIKKIKPLLIGSGGD